MTGVKAEGRRGTPSLGCCLSCPNGENFSGGKPIYVARDMAAQAGGSAGPVQTGQIAVNLNVSITYIIK